MLDRESEPSAELVAFNLDAVIFTTEPSAPTSPSRSVPSAMTKYSST